MIRVHAESLERLRGRTSEKWIRYADDVLPLLSQKWTTRWRPSLRMC